MPLAKQPVQIALGSVDQKTQSKFVQTGRLSVAENVWQAKRRSYRKRGGFATVDRTINAGVITVGKDLVFAGSTPILRWTNANAIGGIAARPAGAGSWTFRGDYNPVTSSYTPATTLGSSRPLMVVVGTQIWQFVQDTTGAWNYSVLDGGLEVVAPRAASAVSQLWARAVSTAGKVWLFTSDGTVVNLYMWSTATPGNNPTATVYGAPTGGGLLISMFDVLDAQGNGNGVVVAVASNDPAGIAFGGATRSIFYSRLNTATGLPDGTGWVGDATTTVGELITPLSFIRADQSASTLHLVFRRQTNRHVMLSAVNAATLVATTTDAGASTLLPNNLNSGLTGYRDAATGNIVLLVTDNSATTENATISTATITAGVISAASVLARARMVVTDPFKIGTRWVLIAQHDDGVFLQCDYEVLDLTSVPGRVLSRTLYQLGGNAWQRGERSQTGVFNNNWNCPVTVSGNVASVLVGSFVSNIWTMMRLSFDFAPADLAQPLAALDGQEVIFPGGYSMVLAAGSTVSDFTPAMYPRGSWSLSVPVTASTLPQGSYEATVLYAIEDRQGNIQRSAESPLQTIAVTAANQVIRFSSVPTLRVLNTNVKVFVEYYLTAVNDTQPFLVKRVPNDTSVDVLATVDIADPPPVGAEILYTDGGALEHIAAPPFKWAAQWRNRIFLGGTDTPDAQVWPSFELVPGFAPAFNEDLRFRIPDGAGKDVMGCPLDFNYFVILKSDSVWLISGQGPDPLGVGSYRNTLQQVSEAPGCNNPRSVVQTPKGVMYQAHNGEIWLVTNGGQAVRIGDGWDDHKGATVTAAVHSSHFSWVLFFTDSAKALVWDYGSPLPEEGSIGQGYVWNLPAAAVGATENSSDIRYVDATGVVRVYTPAQFFDDTSTPILRKVKVPVTLSGIRGYQRLYRGQVVGQFIAQHSLKVTVDNFAGVAGEAGSASQSWTKAVAAGPELFEFRPDRGRVTAMDVTIEDAGSDLTEAATLEGLALEVGLKSGLPRLNTTQRM